MWTLIKGLLLKWAMLKWLLKSLGSLGILVPIAFVLKMIGLPVLMVLAVLALPVLLMLALFGMPFILVFLPFGAATTLSGPVVRLMAQDRSPHRALVGASWLMGWNGSKPDENTRLRQWPVGHRESWNQHSGQGTQEITKRGRKLSRPFSFANRSHLDPLALRRHPSPKRLQSARSGGVAEDGQRRH
jgi:hypothetical protein